MVVRTIERLLLRLWKRWLYTLTAFGRKSFYCDSHPRLCVACHRVRNLLSSHRKDNIIFVNTSKGPYFWTSLKVPIRVVKHG